MSVWVLFHPAATIGSVAALIAALAGIMDWRRQGARRSHPDRVGLIPWTGISVAAVGVALIATAVAIAT